MPYYLFEPDVYPIAADAEAIAIADVTGDGIDDVVVVTRPGLSASSDENQVLVYPGGGLGIADSPQRYPLGFDPFRPGLATADFDQDGKTDVIVGSSDGMTLFRSTGASLAAGVTFDDGDQFHLEDNGVVVATDVNNDGHMDAVGVPWDFDVMLYYGDGKGSFYDTDVFPTDAHGHTTAATGDVDGDSDADLVIMTGLTEHAFGVHPKDGTSYGAAVFHDLPASQFAEGLAIADVTGDDHADVIVSDGLNQSLYVYPQTTGTLGAPTEVPVDPDGTLSVGSPGNIAVADLDGDGDDDLVVALDPSDSIGLFFSGPSGVEDELIAPWLGGLGRGPQGLAVGDLDGDGCTDVAGVDNDNGLVVAMGNCGTGSFDPCPGSDRDADGIGDTCDCAPENPDLPNDDGACPVGDPPPGGPTSTSCDVTDAPGARLGLLAFALAALARRRRISA